MKKQHHLYEPCRQKLNSYCKSISGCALETQLPNLFAGFVGRLFQKTYVTIYIYIVMYRYLYKCMCEKELHMNFESMKQIQVNKIGAPQSQVMYQ